MELMAESFLPRHAILYVERLIHSCGPFLKRTDVLLMYCIKKGGRRESTEVGMQKFN